MYSDFIQYKTAEGVTEQQLRKAATIVFATWMSKQAGFLSWQINTIGENEYLDIVQWESKEAAKKAEKNMKDIPQDSPWYACYDMSSISSKSGTDVYNSNVSKTI